MSGLRGWVFAAAAGAILVACSSGGGSPSAPFSGAPMVTATSTSGVLDVALRLSQEPPNAGLLQGQLTITKASDGSPVDGLTLQVTPWMPQMKHGASVAPTVTAEGSGVYQVNDLDLIMPGLWELKTAVSGPMTDTVNPEFQVQ